MKKALMNNIVPPVESHIRKVSVIGAGTVGMAISMALVTQKICTVLALVDINADKVQGEAMDLEEAAIYTGCRIIHDTDYRIITNSKLCIVAAGTHRQGEESVFNWAQRNVAIMQDIIPKILAYIKEPVILVTTSPVDTMTYAVWKISGLPQNLVLGTGTTLYSARLRNLIASRLGVNPKSVHGFIIGEHGRKSVPVWSSVSVGGVRLIDLDKTIGTSEDSEDWNSLYEKTVSLRSKIVQLKKKTCWAVALCAAKITTAIIRNSCEIFSVSTLAKGCVRADKEVFMSLPCVLGKNGVTSIIKETLTDSEREKVLITANHLYEMQSKLVF